MITMAWMLHSRVGISFASYNTLIYLYFKPLSTLAVSADNESMIRPSVWVLRLIGNVAIFWETLRRDESIY